PPPPPTPPPNTKPLVSSEYQAVPLSGGVGPAHRKNGEAERAQGGVERSHVSRIWMELALVKRYIERGSSINGASGEVFRNYIGIGRHGSVFNSDGIEGL